MDARFYSEEWQGYSDVGAFQKTGLLFLFPSSVLSDVKENSTR